MKKNWITIGIILIVAFTIVFVIIQTKKATENIRIGAVLPLSGSSARYGKWIQEALEIGKEEINSAGGINGKKLEIIYEDDQADPTIATNATRKLISGDKVPLIFGSWASSAVLAQAPIAEQTHTVLMGEAISPKIRDAGDYIFRIQPDARYYLRKFVPFIYKDLNLRKISLFHVNNDFGVDQSDVFKKEFESLGGTILSNDGYEQDATDFKTELTKIKAKNPDGIFCPAYTEIAIILKQAKELGLSQQFLASVPFENLDILKAAGNAVNGVIYPYHFDSNSTDPIIKEYQKKYSLKYGRQSEGFAALAYDGIRIIGNMLKECGSNPSCIKDKLYKVTDFPGVTGPTTFDDHGDVVKQIIIKTVRDGNFVRY
ncbi:MAG: ABC transporter substrate-binding protein [bacterium]|nr:ABC transporter substrate-binding protein [bacterium]